MSGSLFLLDVIAFVVVAYWAYANDRAGAAAGDKGLLKMKKVAVAAAAVAKRAPKWMGRQRAPDDELVDDVVLRRAQPQWKRRLRPRG